MGNFAVRTGSRKSIVWVIISFVAIFILILSYHWIDKILYLQSYQEVKLEIIAEGFCDMSKNTRPNWGLATNQSFSERLEKDYGLILPDVDYNNEMLIISYGSELKRLKYNLREPIFKRREKYIGFPYYKDKEPKNAVFVYRTKSIPLMDTDVAGYPPSYTGKY